MTRKKPRTAPPSEEIVRRIYPELTRCAYCGVLDELTLRWTACADPKDRSKVIGSRDYGDLMLDVIVCIWLHSGECVRGWKEEQLKRGALQWEWPEDRKPVTYPKPFVKVPPAKSYSRFKSRVVPRRKQEHKRCFCCEHYELPEHTAHRISIGYHPKDPWPGRLAPGEII